ncbi:MAG: hypothetical protein NTY19_41105 [Planctomycetota bacterium]|nr:hypothetical protein [Planctomycetota bacterium]
MCWVPRRSCRTIGWQIPVLALLGEALLWVSAMACDTPVYRYAMYRWEPAPYEVFFFHSGPIDAVNARLNGLIQAAQAAAGQPANITLLPVDLSKDAELKTVPRQVREAWTSQKNPQPPSYLVYTPTGINVFAGHLDEAALQKMLRSPARDEITKQLAEGKAGVLVLVTGPDAKATAEAEKLIADVIQEIADGKIPFYTPPTAAEGAPGQANAGPKLAVGWVQVARDDPRERWLVEALLSSEEDLKAERFASEHMVFPVFGRGRALPPCVGKGVTRDNLIACVEFVTGACSCTVKDQNPGVDLLIAHDWLATAEKLAEGFGMEEGNESQLGAAGLFPQLMIPAGAAKEPAASSDDAHPGEEAKPGSQPSTPDAAAPSIDAAKSDAAPSHEQQKSKLNPESQSLPVGESSTPSEPEATEEDELPSPATLVTTADDVFSSVLFVGAGVAAALVLLFGLTFFILRPR